METDELQNQVPPPEKLWEERTSNYYGRYPATIEAKPHRSLWRRLHRISLYIRLIVIGVMAIIIGGIFPLAISYEIFFKPFIVLSCNQCQIVNSRPYFEFDYILGTILGVLGFMMPIIVLYVLIKILQNRVFRRDLFD